MFIFSSKSKVIDGTEGGEGRRGGWRHNFTSKFPPKRKIRSDTVGRWVEEEAGTFEFNLFCIFFSVDFSVAMWMKS